MLASAGFVPGFAVGWVDPMMLRNGLKASRSNDVGERQASLPFFRVIFLWPVIFMVILK